MLDIQPVDESILGEIATPADAQASGSIEGEKPKRAQNKRKFSAAYSCIRTDLFELCPNAGKAKALDHLLEHYRTASIQMGQLIWAGILVGDKAKDAWKQVDKSNALAGRSTLLQPAEAQARGVIASHLGWLEKDVGRKINIMARRLNKRICAQRKDDPDAQRSSVAKLDGFIHELRAINAAHAWNWLQERQAVETVMKADGVLKTASARAYACCSKLFKIVERRRSFPDLSACQLEATRGGAKLFGSEAGMPASVLSQLGISLEASQDEDAPFGHWVRVTVADPSLDALAPSKAESILIPAKSHKAFNLRHSGSKGVHAGFQGPEGFPIHPKPKKFAPTPQRKPPHRSKRFEKERLNNKLNPAQVLPEAVESLMFIKRLGKDAKGNVSSSYYLAVRTQMGEAFAESRAAYAKRTHLVDTLAIDWGVKNFITFNHEVSIPPTGKEAQAAAKRPKGAPTPPRIYTKRHGVGFLQNEVEPLLAQAVELEGQRQKLKAKHVAESLRELFASYLPKLHASKPEGVGLKDLFLLNESLKPSAMALHSGFDLSTSKSRALRAQAKGKVETFIGAILNHAVNELRPRAFVVEKLDFRGGGLSAELNNLIANAGRFFVERKLKDLHEKYGPDIYRIDAAYTSQECSMCGYIHESNRKGEAFQCLACGHKAHADENAADCIEKRRSLPGACRLAKGKKGFSWLAQGTLPRLPHDEFVLLKSAGIRFPALWAALRDRPITESKARAAAGSSAADDLRKDSSPPKKEPPSVSTTPSAARFTAADHSRSGTKLPERTHFGRAP